MQRKSAALRILETSKALYDITVHHCINDLIPIKLNGYRL